MYKRSPKSTLRALILWATALTILFLIGAFITHQGNSFLSDILLNLAFTILSSILVAILLAGFLDARERERWTTFDRNNLIDLRDVLYNLLYEVLHIPTYEACTRTNNDFVSDAFDYMLAEYRHDSERFLAYLGSVKEKLDVLYENEKLEVCTVFLHRSQSFTKHLTTLEQLLQRATNSPFVSTEIIDAFRDIIVSKRLIEPFLEANPYVSKTDQAEAVTFQALKIIESALVAYDATTRELRTDKT